MVVESIYLQEGLSNASLTAYLQDSYFEVKHKGVKPAIIICPGGAFMSITEKEAEPVALRFLAEGYQAFVLHYSIGSEVARFPVPFLEAAKAVMLVRENAERWSIDPDKIGICGFSTGGYIAAYLAAAWHEDYLSEALKVENKLIRPNALILGYPLLDIKQFRARNKDKSTEMNMLLEMMFGTIYGTFHPDTVKIAEWDIIERISAKMPPTFLWTTAEEDYVGMEECTVFMKALANHEIPYEFHVFERGIHGLSLGDHTVGYSMEEVKTLGNTSTWFSMAIRWLHYYFD